MKRIATDAAGNLRRFFSPEQVAAALGVHRKTILRQIKAGVITAYMPTAQAVRIPGEEIERLMQERSIGRPA